MATLSFARPQTVEEAAETLGALNGEGRAVRIRGGASKPWTSTGHLDDALVLDTTGLCEIVAHNPGDMTATLQPGVRLADAQRAFADAGQMLALDPPLGLADDASATIGGIVATGDSGPLAHRYGGPRDLVVGATAVLGDGTVARSGGTVIKNVAGYDVAKLLCGSFGTLGLIASVNVRLHPLGETVTARGRSGDAARLATAAGTLAALPAELEALDVSWSDGAGALLARCGGREARSRAQRIAAAMREAGLDEVSELDGAEEARAWEDQRGAQRSADAAVLLVSARPGALREVLDAAASVRGTLVARAALGQALVTVAPDRVADLRGALPAGATSVLRDCPAGERAAVDDPWGTVSEPVLALTRAVKARFDPAGTCNPGTFVGGV